MDFSFDIFQIYTQYRDITSRAVANEGEDYGWDDELEKTRVSREALSRLSKVVESKVSARVSILDEVYKLMLRLDLLSDYSEFSRFYDFVFFICRENGQKNITVSRAVMAWRLVLAGRFRLLNRWCDFVEKNHRHTISEDTWRQVLAFSRCVHESLEGYDPREAWPVLIDDFAEYMYSTIGSRGTTNSFCNCGDSEPQQHENTPSGLRNIPGSKRKLAHDSHMEHECSDSSIADSKTKHHRYYIEDSIRHNNNSGLGSGSKSPCAVEGCLAKGFEGLLSSGSRMQFGRDTRLSFT